ncbi:MAG: hypothetical protein V8R00_07540 [Coprococcus catus]
MQLLKIECKKMIKSKEFRIALCALLVVSILQGVENLKFVRWVSDSSINMVHPIGLDNISLKVRWMGADDYTLFGACFYMLLPLLSAMAYSPSYLKEIRSGYAIQFFVRTKKKNYIICKWIITFMSGILVVGIPLIVNLMINALFCPLGTVRILSLQTAVVQGSFYSELFYEKPIRYMLLTIILGALWGGICALLGMACSMFVNNVIVASIAPLIGLNLMGVVLDNINRIFNITDLAVAPTDLMRAACHNKNPEGYVWGYCCIFLGVISICILKRGMQREII